MFGMKWGIYAPATITDSECSLLADMSHNPKKVNDSKNKKKETSDTIGNTDGSMKDVCEVADLQHDSPFVLLIL